LVLGLSVASFGTWVTILIGMTKMFVGPNIGEDCFPLEIGIKDGQPPWGGGINALRLCDWGQV
jgi:hypothetical protein